MIEGVALDGADEVGGVEAEDVHLEAGTHREVLAVALQLVLVIVTAADEELVVVAVFGTERDVDLLQLFTETVVGVGEGPEGGREGVHRLVVVAAFGEVGVRLALALNRFGGHEILVEVEVDADLVVIVDRVQEASADLEVGGQELLAVSAVERDLGTEVRDVITEAPEALALPEVDVLLEVARDVDRYGVGRLQVLVDGGVHVRPDVAQGHGHGVILRELHTVTQVEGHFVGVEVGDLLSAQVGDGHLTEREVAQRGADGRSVVGLVIARGVGHVDVLDELAEPGGVRDADAGFALHEGVFRGVPILRVDVGQGGGADVAHTAAARIGGDGKRGDSRVDGAELFVLVLCMQQGRGQEQRRQQADDSTKVHHRGLCQCFVQKISPFITTRPVHYCTQVKKPSPSALSRLPRADGSLPTLRNE